MIETKFVVAERDEIDVVKQDYSMLRRADNVQQILNSISLPTVILNQKRQVVYGNYDFLKTLGLYHIDEALGKRVGELLNCIYAFEEDGGCGTALKCSMCGGINTFLQAQRYQQKKTSEARITSLINDQIVAMDFRVTIAPFYLGLKTFYIVSLIDISNEKRKNALERIFFHDVINKTGCIKGLLEVVKSNDNPEECMGLIDNIDALSESLTQMILHQRDITAAENNELIVNHETHNSLDFVHLVKNQLQGLEIAKNKRIHIDGEAEDLEVFTDYILFQRVLLNLCINALEATPNQSVVSLGYYQENNDYCRFWVHNDSVMPEEVQLQVFQRSFSTKSHTRGLGTYSIKLLTENYLNGKVSFVSNEKEGTRFFIDLPQKCNI